MMTTWETLASTSKLFVIVGLGFQLLACGSPSPSKPNSAAPGGGTAVIETTDKETVSLDEAPSDGGNGDGIVTMAEGFALTTHKLVFERCGYCHGQSTSPLFASSDPKASFDEAFKNGKVNLLNIDSSRLVLRLDPDKHYCWGGDCKASAKEMKDALEAWKAAITDGSIVELEKKAKRYLTTPLLLSAAVNVDNPDIVENPGQFIVEAESGTLSGGLAVAEDPKGSGGKVLVMGPAGNTVTFNFPVTVAGTYYVYGLTSSEAAANTTATGTLNGVPTTWTAPLTGANQWVWNKVQGASVALQAGATATFSVARLATGFKVDAIALTTDASFAGSAVLPPKANVLKFDLSKAAESKVPAGTFLEIQALDFDENSYKFKSPFLRVPSGSVKVNKLKIILNGTWSPSNATYVLVDETVSAPGKFLSQAAMIVPKEKDAKTDLISVQFEVLEPGK